MKSFVSLALIALVFRSTEQSVQQEINDNNFREGVTPYCNEVCPPGYEYIPELGHCYQLLLDLGPTSQDRGVLACGYALGYLPAINEEHDEDIIRAYFWNKYSDQMMAHPNYLENSGFWTAYMRMAQDGIETISKKLFVNMYTGDKMPKKIWRYTNRMNERFDQACVARKWFYAEFLGNASYGNIKNGVDDYVCAFPHWVICQVRKEFALNKRGYNVELMRSVRNGEVMEAGSESCEQKWASQTADQFNIMFENAQARGNERALSAFMVAEDNIKTPTMENVNVT